MDLVTWALFEIEYRRGGVVMRPVAEEMASHGRPGERNGAMAALRLLKAQGWPAARGALSIEKIGDGRTQQLKCKPGCWRIYFHVIVTEKAFLLLHAICKKEQRRTSRRRQNDSDKASKRLGEYQAGKAFRSQVAL